MTDANTPIIIHAYTWFKDSFGLYDYKSKEIETQSFRGIGSFHVYRDEDNGVYCSPEQLGPYNILHIAKSRNKFYVAPSGIDDLSNLYFNHAWNIVKFQEVNQYGFRGK